MGLLTSRRFAESGGSVVMTDINGEILEQRVAEINAIRAGAATGVVCDVRRYEQISHACQVAVDTYGRIDLAVPFAGGAELRMLGVKGLEFPDVPIEVYDWSLDVNLRSQLYLDHAVLKYMREQKSGVIVHIGSVTGEEGSAGNVGYATTKSGAMYGLTKSIAQYGAKYGIRCCCVSPGPVLTREAMANMDTLLGRAAEPIEVVNFVLYLASDEGAILTGHNYFVDGGRIAMLNKTWTKRVEGKK